MRCQRFCCDIRRHGNTLNTVPAASPLGFVVPLQRLHIGRYHIGHPSGQLYAILKNGLGREHGMIDTTQSHSHHQNDGHAQLFGQTGQQLTIADGHAPAPAPSINLRSALCINPPDKTRQFAPTLNGDPRQRRPDAAIRRQARPPD
jgi:hypothetical protein